MPSLTNIKKVHEYILEDPTVKASTIANKEGMNYYTALRCVEIVEYFMTF